MSRRTQAQIGIMPPDIPKPNGETEEWADGMVTVLSPALVDIHRAISTLVEGSVLADAVDTDYTSQTTNYDVATTDNEGHTIFVDTDGAERTITLPDAAEVPGREYIIKKTSTDAFGVVVDTAGGDIEGVAAPAAVWGSGGTRESRTYKSDGTDWWII